MATPRELAVPLSTGSVPVVDLDGAPHVVLTPVLQALGLSVEMQVRRLRRQPWAARTVRTTGVEAADGRHRQMVVTTVQTFLMLMATIEPSRVAPAVREQVVAYQCESAEAIRDYWTRGLAVNPRGRSALELAVLDNVDGLRLATGLLQQFHYFDQVAEGRRDDPHFTRAQARRKATEKARSAYARMVAPVLGILAAEQSLDGPESL